MAPTDKIEVKAKFSLPYKPGMETEPGYVGKSMQTLKVYSPDEMETAQFLLVASKTIQDWQAALKKAASECEKHGTIVFARNAMGNQGITTLITKYKIGGLGKRLINDAQKVFTLTVTKGGATPEKAYKQVVAFFGMKGEIITPEQLIEAGVK